MCSRVPPDPSCPSSFRSRPSPSSSPQAYRAGSLITISNDADHQSQQAPVGPGRGQPSGADQPEPTVGGGAGSWLMAHVVDNVMHARLRLCDDTTGRRRSVRRGTASEPSWGRTAAWVKGEGKVERISYLLVSGRLPIQQSCPAGPQCTRPRTSATCARCPRSCASCPDGELSPGKQTARRHGKSRLHATHPALAPSSTLAVVDDGVDPPRRRGLHLAQQLRTAVDTLARIRFGGTCNSVEDVQRADAARARRAEGRVDLGQALNDVVAVRGGERLGHIPQFTNFGARQARCAHRPVEQVIEGLGRSACAWERTAAETACERNLH